MTFLWIGPAIGIAIILQTIELFFIAPYEWTVTQFELPRMLRPMLQPYGWWLFTRLAAALVVLFIPSPIAIGLLVLSSWVIAVRWRGTFNGGSDGMTMVVLLAWWVASVHPAWTDGCLWYIAIQAMLSYFVAGLVKLRHREWRTGQALGFFLSRRPRPSDGLLSWGIILYECLWPLALVRPQAALLFMILGVMFHLANTYLFGLNRFFFAWLATYPAVYWASWQWHSH